MKTITEKERKVLDNIYAIGFKNGQIVMKGKILKKINQDWSLVTIRPPMDLIMKILKMVNKIPLNKPTFKDTKK